MGTYWIKKALGQMPAIKVNKRREKQGTAQSITISFVVPSPLLATPFPHLSLATLP